MRVRHEGISFNFCGKGEWYTPESQEELRAMVDRYPDLEVNDTVNVQYMHEGEPIGKPIAIDVKISGDDETAEILASPPIRCGSWYSWQGKKYRRSDLPAEALALLE